MKLFFVPKKSIPVLAGVLPVWLTVELVNGNKKISSTNNSAVVLKEIPDVYVEEIRLPSGGGGGNGISIPSISSSRGSSSGSSRGSSSSSSSSSTSSSSSNTSQDQSGTSQDQSQSQQGSSSSSSEGGKGGADGGGSSSGTADPRELLAKLLKGMNANSERLKNNATSGGLSGLYEIITKVNLITKYVTQIKSQQGTGADTGGGDS